MRIHAWVVADQPQMQRELLANLEEKYLQFSYIEYRKNAWEDTLAAQVERDGPGIVILCLWQTNQVHRLVGCLREQFVMPIFVLHNKESYYEELLCMQKGADDFQSMTRPVPLLWERIYRLVRLYQGKMSEAWNCHGLVEEPKERQFFWQGNSLELTDREYLVLSWIVHSREDVIEKKKLLYHIWGGEKGMEKSSRALDTVMKQLRRKVRMTSITIETCYGIGYRKRWKEI